jgi:hypothetical protein
MLKAFLPLAVLFVLAIVLMELAFPAATRVPP